MLNIKKRHVKEHLEQERKGKFSYHSPKFYNDCIFCLRKCLLHFLCSLLCYLFMYENVQISIKEKILYIFWIVSNILDYSKIPFAQNCWFLTLLSCLFLLLLDKLPPLYTSVHVITLKENFKELYDSFLLDGVQLPQG